MVPRPRSSRGSRRYYRGRVVALLRDLPPEASASLWDVGSALNAQFAQADVPWLVDLLTGLESDGLLSLAGEQPNLRVSLSRRLEARG